MHARAPGEAAKDPGVQAEQVEEAATREEGGVTVRSSIARGVSGLGRPPDRLPLALESSEEEGFRRKMRGRVPITNDPLKSHLVSRGRSGSLRIA